MHLETLQIIAQFIVEGCCRPAARHPHTCSLTLRPPQVSGQKRWWKKSWILLRTGRSLTNNRFRQNRLDFGKINRIIWQLEWWEAKTKTKTPFSIPSPQAPFHSFVITLLPPSLTPAERQGMGDCGWSTPVPLGHSSFLMLFSSVGPSQTAPAWVLVIA